MLLPVKYIPKKLTKKDRAQQKKMLLTSRRLYKQHKYYTRKKVSSYKSKPSKHVLKAMRVYHLKNVTPSAELSRKTGCTLKGLKKIVNKGEGAYYSSGSRPNQTARSWGLARLASAITGGKSAVVDFHIIKKSCKPTKKAYSLAKKALKKYGRVTRRVPKSSVYT